MRHHIAFFLVLLVVSCGPTKETSSLNCDVLVIGGGASGVMAGIQSARMGASTLIVEETVWLGGMLTAAGVSAIDGNYKLPSGLWEEFRQRLYAYYGGEDSVKTGWVSNVLFEPQVGAQILSEMASAESSLQVQFESQLTSLTETDDGWTVSFSRPEGNFSVETNVVIDATELGDAAKMAGIPYDVGMDGRGDTGEDIAPEEKNDIVQDMTYVAVLEEFPEGTDMTIPKPDNYDPTPFYCTCAGKCAQDTIPRTLWECDQMMRYGKLPNNKYMINWPIYGNDYYANVVNLGPEERMTEFEKAKDFTKQYLYYLQTELGYSNFGIAEDLYPTEDGFPMIPYHRESRRIHGIVQFNINDLARPFEQEDARYRTGIAVGDYPVDHHHAAYPDHQKLPDLHFYPVPSYSIPLGSLIPKSTPNFIVAEKSISVTNLVNGTTRLQPVCLLIGQAAGTLAALSIHQNLRPSEVSVRHVQEQLLSSDAMILPYVDVSTSDPAFKAIQRVGATGILKGEGVNVGWENKTLFYPDSLADRSDLQTSLSEFYTVEIPDGSTVNFELVKEIAVANSDLTADVIDQKMEALGRDFQLNLVDAQAPLTRRQVAVLLDELLNPFEVAIDHFGNLAPNPNL
ncbi:MAG: FAD-dependent oxidoreductase [Bacteroidota bacterium]